MDGNEILKLITDYKEKRGFSDEEWSKHLGISWGQWSRIKNGSRRLTENVLSKIAAKCPEIDLRIFEYMRQKGGE